MSDIGYSCLHSHLGSSVPLDDLWYICNFDGINPNIKKYDGFCKMVNEPFNKIKHGDYLNKFTLTQKIQSRPLAIEKSVFFAIANAYRHGVRLNELRFNPMLRNQNGLYDIDTIIMAAANGLFMAEKSFAITSGLIVETDRTFTEKQSCIIAEKAVKYKHLGIIGFDISGPNKKGFSIKRHKKAFDIARAGGLGLTAHTGELTSAGEVARFIETINPDRIGHGIQIWKDKSVMKMVADNRITLEICPTSNVKTGIVPNYFAFVKILSTLRENNVNFTINSDGPVFLNSNVKDEFQRLKDVGALDNMGIEACKRNSYSATFIKLI